MRGGWGVLSLVLNAYEDAPSQIISDARMSLCPGKVWPVTLVFDSGVFPTDGVLPTAYLISASEDAVRLNIGSSISSRCELW